MANKTAHFLAGDIVERAFFEAALNPQKLEANICHAYPVDWGQRFVDFMSNGPVFTVAASCEGFRQREQDASVRQLTPEAIERDASLSNQLWYASRGQETMRCMSRCGMAP